MKLYFSPFSPYVRKCLVVGYELGLNDHIELLDSNAHPVNRDLDIVKSNPLGKVPTFFDKRDQPLFDSRVICEYLNHEGQGDLFPAQAEERWSALVLHALADGILDAALLARYETVARPEQYYWQDWMQAQMEKINSCLDYLETGKLTLDQRPTIGTISIGCALWYLDLRFSDFDWRQAYPKVAAWYAEFSQRPSMAHEWSLKS